MTRGQIMDTFFAPLEELKRREKEPQWCELSEMRLFQLIIRYKPAGVNKHFMLSSIRKHMCKLYEDEEAFEYYLNDADLEIVRSRKDLPMAEKTLSFEPRYKIRPTSEQIEERLKKYWDMTVIEYNEGVPDGFEVHSEFFLPDGQFSELMKEKEEANAAAAASGPISSSKRRSRRGGTPDSADH
ncbi:CT20 family protein [Ancylostoma duodenale]|uniref:CT20 family protein n=1 Tax=Ancylostoma duodenale TaxID=51022 RepID=A0A0C2GZQ8_9BILA|nr:CT20 family protein [Ancylostoma duodenale]